jgi:hypothetical protein
MQTHKHTNKTSNIHKPTKQTHTHTQAVLAARQEAISTTKCALDTVLHHLATEPPPPKHVEEEEVEVEVETKSETVIEPTLAPTPKPETPIAIQVLTFWK